MSGFFHVMKTSGRFFHGAVIFVFVAVRTPHILPGGHWAVSFGAVTIKAAVMRLHRSLGGHALSPLRFTMRAGVAGFEGPVPPSVELWKILPKSCTLP